jgi:hypothetical protein
MKGLGSNIIGKRTVSASAPMIAPHASVPAAATRCAHAATRPTNRRAPVRARRPVGLTSSDVLERVTASMRAV